jgi:hypothetical protein
VVRVINFHLLRGSDPLQAVLNMKCQFYDCLVILAASTTRIIYFSTVAFLTQNVSLPASLQGSKIIFLSTISCLILNACF